MAELILKHLKNLKRLENPECLKILTASTYQLEEKIPKDCRIAILTASTDIQNVVDRLYKCGVLGLIDFTHQHISVPKGMILKEIDIVANIQELVFETNTLKKFK